MEDDDPQQRRAAGRDLEAGIADDDGDGAGGNRWDPVRDEINGAGSAEPSLLATVEAAVEAQAAGAMNGGPSAAPAATTSSPTAAAPEAKAPAPAVARARPAPPQKSYLPVFIAPEAYGKKPDPTRIQIQKEVEAHMAKVAAKKEREKANKKKKKTTDDKKSAVTDGDLTKVCEVPLGWGVHTILK